jgi:hypothetical protein
MRERFRSIVLPFCSRLVLGLYVNMSAGTCLYNLTRTTWCNLCRRI